MKSLIDKFTSQIENYFPFTISLEKKNHGMIIDKNSLEKRLTGVVTMYPVNKGLTMPATVAKLLQIP